MIPKLSKTATIAEIDRYIIDYREARNLEYIELCHRILGDPIPEVHKGKFNGGRHDKLQNSRKQV